MPMAATAGLLLVGGATTAVMVRRRARQSVASSGSEDVGHVAPEGVQSIREDLASHRRDLLREISQLIRRELRLGALPGAEIDGLRER
jgi:hypothetical protein